MDDSGAYKEKLQNLQKFIPFLNNMMNELKAKGNREAQFNKIQSLHAMITDRKKKLKLETLNRCEEVLNNLYCKVNPHMKKDAFETPRSPSPQKDEFIFNNKPITIPTEKVKPSKSEYSEPRESHPPKVDIYSSAAESLAKSKHKKRISPIRVPDTTKPPISLDDLKTLEDDVQDKINSVKLSNASISQLNELRNQISLQLKVEEINKAMSPVKSKSSSKKHKSPEKNKEKAAKEKSPKDTLKQKTAHGSESIFENTLSNIDNRLLEEKKKEKKSSLEKENKITKKELDFAKEKLVDNKEAKTESSVNKQEETNSVKLNSEDEFKGHDTIDKSAKTDDLKATVEDKPTNQNTTDANQVLPGSNDTVEIDLTNDCSESKPPPPSQAFKRLADKYNRRPRKSSVEIIEVEKEVSDIIDKNMQQSPVKVLNMMPKVPEPTPPPASLVRLTMNSNKPAGEKRIELPPILQKMFSPKPVPPVSQNIPVVESVALVNRYPGQEPARTMMSPPSAQPPLLSPPIQNQFVPSANRPALMPTPVPSPYTPVPNHPGQPMMGFEQQMHRPVFPAPNQQRPMQIRPSFPTQQDMNSMNQFRMNVPIQNPPYMQQPIRNPNFMVPFRPEHQFRPEQPRFNQFSNDGPPYIDNYRYDNCGPPVLQPEVGFFEQKATFDRGWMEPGQSWGEPNQHNWHDPRGNRDPRSYREYRAMKEKEATRDPRINREPQRDFRGNARDPRTAREPQEVNEPNKDNRNNVQEEPRDGGRDPRVARDRWNQEARDPRSQRERWDPRSEAKETRIDKWSAKGDPRDPKVGGNRGNRTDNNDDVDFHRDNSREYQKDDSKKNKETESRGRSVNREKSVSKPREIPERKRSPNRARSESKFDKVYSKTGEGREGLNLRDEEVFTSPLDSLYSGKPSSKTGKGYGFQSFRIPKIKKPDPPPRPPTPAVVKSSNVDVVEVEEDFSKDVELDSVDFESSGDELNTDISGENRSKKNSVDAKDNKKGLKAKGKYDPKVCKTRRKIINLIDDDDDDMESEVNNTRTKHAEETKAESSTKHTVSNERDNDNRDAGGDEDGEFTLRRSPRRRSKRQSAKLSLDERKNLESHFSKSNVDSEASVDNHKPESLSSQNSVEELTDTIKEKEKIINQERTLEPENLNEQLDAVCTSQKPKTIAPNSKSADIDELKLTEKSPLSLNSASAEYYQTNLESSCHQSEVSTEKPELPELRSKHEQSEQLEMKPAQPAEKQEPVEKFEPTEEKKSEHTEQNILAHFFENLLKSKNKRDKKTALFSLIETFSDSFSDRELHKISKIIKTDEDNEKDSSDEEPKKEEKKEAKDELIENITPTIEAKEEEGEASSVAGSEVLPELDKPDVSTDSEKIVEPKKLCDKVDFEDAVVVSVGERIKYRRRQAASPSKPKPKHKTELDLLHADIQEMFIRDGVLTATGKRMCRILKADPNALSPVKGDLPIAEEPKKVRRKPGPKSKTKQIASDINNMKTIKVVLSKMPENVLHTRKLRNRLARSTSTKDTDDESDDSEGDKDKTINSDQSDADLSDVESKSQTSDTPREKSKEKKKRKRSSWAAGIIPKPKKKSALKSDARDELDKQSGVASPEEPDDDKTFAEPDKTYFLDPTGRKSMPCKLCDFKGTSICHHYKTEHPLSEVLCSRLEPKVAKATIKEAVDNADKFDSIKKAKGVSRYLYSCRMCNFTNTCFPLMFYEHITTHTGEYRHSCGYCGHTTASSKALQKHFQTLHSDAEKKASRKCYNLPVVFGYMCGECNYVQLNESNVEEHANIFHLGEKPKIYKINMSTSLDPALLEANKDEDDDSVAKEPPMPVLKKAEGRKKPGPKPKNAPELIADEDTPSQEKKHDKKSKKTKSTEYVQSDSDTEVSTPKVIYKKPGPKSKTMNIENKKLEVKPKRSLRTRNLSKSSDITSETSDDEFESRKNLNVKRRQDSVSSDTTDTKQTEFGGISHGDKKLLRENKLADVILEGRGRAAKEKASAKLKCLMEEANSLKLRSPIKAAPRDDSPSKETTSNTTTTSENESSPIKTRNKSDDEQSDDDDIGETSLGNDSSSEDESPLNKSEIEDSEKIEKEKEDATKLNIFTCETDILQEERKIEEERLKKMDELTKTIGSRTSKLDFVEKLSTRLKDADEVPIKEEPKEDDAIDIPNPELSHEIASCSQETDSALSKESKVDLVILNKKPMLDEDLQLPPPTLNFPQNKSNALFSNMIEKLQGHLSNQEHNSEGVDEDSNPSDSKGPVHKTVIGDFICLSVYDDGLEFECCFNSCKFKQKDKDLFRIHCQTAHDIQIQSTLCEKCGEGILPSNITFLESLFDHILTKHVTVANEPHFAKPQGRVLRIRKLSGDNLSVKKEAEEVKENANVDEPAPLELSGDNPFPFKIADVMSLAESDEPETSLPQLNPIVDHHPPPLTLIASKPSATPQPTLVVKEAKMTSQEIARPRKTPKAMAKFIQSASDLYKCPHMYCLFTTNFRDFLERHMQAHNVDGSIMTPCVYCDMKTPWEHVPMHIYIRHAHCRFACSNCLYRAALKDYVVIHQDVVHGSKDYSVIALPVHKQARKFAVADVKLDPKTLCKPYKCVEPNMEFLFENEFVWHLKSVHGGITQRVLCGQRGCTARHAYTEMVLHWQNAHGVGRYQCAYCTTVAIGDFAKLSEHFALCHPSQLPEYYMRTLTRVDPNNLVGYTYEAFLRLSKRSKLTKIGLPEPFLRKSITTIPAPAPPSEPQPVPRKPPLRVILPSTSKPIAVNTNLKTIRVTKPSELNLLSTMSSGQTIVLSPKMITTVANQGSPTKTATVPVKSPIFVQPPQVSISRDKLQVAGDVIKLVGSSNNTTPIKIPTEMMDLLKVVETSSGPVRVKTTSIMLNGATGQENDNLETLSDSNSQDNDIVTPVEHIELAAEPSAITDSPLALDLDIDPLNIDAILPDPLASTSDDESDSNHASDTASTSDKSEKAKLSKGLLGYDLYKCRFCGLSFADVKGFKGHAVSSASCRGVGGKPFKCAHCDRQLRNAQRLVEHIRTHGVLRFSCSLCAGSFSSQLQIKGHMKFRHNISQTTCVPVDPNKNNMETDEFVVRPTQVIPNEKPAAEKTISESPVMEELTFTPDQIDKLPIRQIFSHNVKCGLCHYANKVRINIVRHLQMHLEEKQVSDSAPVNPVPCLEKNEKMFDKMTNLAASSFVDGRMGGKKTEGKPKEKEEKFPEFVPTHCRFVCCAQGCSYLCPEEGNLRHHLIALHSHEAAFTCSHCGDALAPPDADSLIKHFKLHGLHLYKCQYCRFLHHLKHKVERHVADTHLDAPVKVVVLRSMESEPSPDAATTTPSTSGAATTKHKPWRCCMCKYRCNNEDEIKTHTSAKHDIDFQLKCTLCNYKTDEFSSFDEHFKEVHPKNEVDIIYVYRKVEEEQQKEDVNEPFDTTPLWSRDKPRVRHIRGILFDEALPQMTKTLKKTQKGLSTSRGTPPLPPSPSTSPLPSTSSSSAPMSSIHLMESIEAVATGADSITTNTEETTVKSGITVSPSSTAIQKRLDDIMPTVDETQEEEDSAVIVIDDDDDVPKTKDKDSKDNPLAKNKGFKRKGTVTPEEVVPLKAPKVEEEEVIDLDNSPDYDLDSEYGEKRLMAEFGSFGFPHNKQLKCPKCNSFKSKRMPDFIFHIFKDCHMFRYRCRKCSDESITYKYMKDHIKQHPFACEEYIEVLQKNVKLETWIQMVIREQSLQILVNNTWIKVLKSKETDADDPSLITCDYCHKKFKDLDFYEHMFVHWSEKPYQCGYCVYQSYTDEDVVQHCKTAHSDATARVVKKGPTVEETMKKSDDSHKRQSDETTAIIKKIKTEVTANIKTEQQNRNDTDEDLVIVTNVDDVPDLSVNFGCDHCEFASKQEEHMTVHMYNAHSNISAKYHKITEESENPLQHMSCNHCNYINSEMKVREHFTKMHPGQVFAAFRFVCRECNSRFPTERSLSQHVLRSHPDKWVFYTTAQKGKYTRSGKPVSAPTSTGRTFKLFKCPMCIYQNVSHSATNLKMHLRGHFRPIECGLCHAKFRMTSDTSVHFVKMHQGQPEKIVTNEVNMTEMNRVAARAIRNAVPVVPAGEAPPTRPKKNIARKSTSARHVQPEEFSFYGSQPERVDLRSLKTYVEVNQINMATTVDQLSRMFDLNPVVEVVDFKLMPVDGVSEEEAPSDSNDELIINDDAT